MVGARTLFIMDDLDLHLQGHVLHALHVLWTSVPKLSLNGDYACLDREGEGLKGQWY